ncbi:glutamate-5-semialdehyde dehydrogenase [Reichenbachiella sp. MALMAid0571]|uniref:glutamate-5-semialdehyde dehydrogenase n=1 Tax=Reichenbachiella sp. MALMAid0571 TaxID=3143939 RepID=UPI0032DEAE3F
MNTLQPTFQNAKQASRELLSLSEDTIKMVLVDVAQTAIDNIPLLLAANQKDLERMDKNDPKYDRLMLTETRIKDIAADIINVSKLKSPVGEVISEKTLENGLHLSKVRVPMGVIGIIYEARPNVSFDVFSLCFKTKNACILKGSSDAEYSNTAIVALIQEVLEKHGINKNMVTLLPTDRSATTELLNAREYVDVIIPRGSQNLINFVRENAKVPTIETGAGIVHIYFDESGDLSKGSDIICNSKTRRVSVCNALDCLLIHKNRLADLESITAPLAEKETAIYADALSFERIKDHYPAPLLFHADEEHFGTEFLSNKMAIKTVNSLDEALDHISAHSSKHSEAIISEDSGNIEKFLNGVDAAAVYANTSTAFTDGAQFGLGAEIGISTQKLHARGPMALEEITTYKWIVKGDGHTRA